MSAGDHKIEQTDFRKGAIALLPLITKGIVVTTNFDCVLEKGFAQNNSAFESVISGPRPDLIVDALHGNKKTLIKLHGDWQDRVGRTFSKADYESNYGDENIDSKNKKRELLISSEELIFSSRSLLFIGASLSADRTVNVLKNIHEKYAGIRYFAILNIPMNESQLDETKFNEVSKRIKAYGIIPIWYKATSPNQHNLGVERRLKRIIEELSTSSFTTNCTT